jgi:hypothetical protein
MQPQSPIAPIDFQVKNLEFIFTIADALWSSERRQALGELILGPITLGHPPTSASVSLFPFPNYETL